MKKTDLSVALFSLSFSLNAYAMGLGDLKVNSYLDQPFNAEIELIDVGGTPLSSIKATLASMEDYERSGLDRAYALSLLTFTVEKNTHGKTVIKVRSSERISEPFMQLFVDLSWAEGDVDRSYTVLLDPQNYQLTQKRLRHTIKGQSGTHLSSHQTGAIETPVFSHVQHTSTSAASDSREVVTYGPTAVNETVWQIAQRYKTDDILLQQMILAIVGTNPQAFTEGNLNGLKEGSHLRIPAASSASKVPEALAKLEVLAHDKAWQARLPIEHALFPPYIDTNGHSATQEQQEVTPLGYAVTTSVIPAVPVISKVMPSSESPFSRFLPLASSLLSVTEDATPNAAAKGNVSNQNNPGVTEQAKNKAEVDIATAAINTVRETNALLVEQLRATQLDNKRLEQQLALREKQLTRMQKKIHQMISRQGLAGQVSQQSLNTEKSAIWPWIILFLALGAGGFNYWWLWIRPRIDKTDPSSETMSPPPLEPILVPPVVETKPVIVESTEDIIPKPPEEPPILPVADVQERPAVVEENEEFNTEVPQQETAVDDHVLEFEPVPPVDTESQDNEIVPEPKKKTKQGPKPTLKSKQTVEPTLEPAPELEQKSEIEPKLESLPEQELKPEPIQEQQLEPQSEPKQDEIPEDEHSIEFVLNPVEVPLPPEEKAPPLKSKAALDTLLALAKTYIGMDDFEAAKQSLQEVLEFGNEEQQSEAQHLLDKLNEH